MIALLSPMLSGAWWFAKLVGFRTAATAAAGRYVNGNLVLAIAVTAAIVAVPLGIWWLRHDAASDAAAAATSHFKIEQGKATWRATFKQLMADRRTMAAADKARATAFLERDYARMRVLELEQQLHALGDDPVIYPRDLVRTMRK